MDFDFNVIAPDIFKILLAVLVGGLIGIERELRDKDAGFRTLIFICAGATLFTIFSLKLSPIGDPGRIASNIVSGVGFLGAGVILRESGQVRGLTTASTVWLVAALGMGIGSGHFLFAFTAALLFLFVLLVFPHIEAWVNQFSETRTYSVVVTNNRAKLDDIEQALRANGLKIKRRKQGRCGEKLTASWEAYGRTSSHQKVLNFLFDDSEIEEFQY